MSAEPVPSTSVEGWAEWEGQVVNGIFPLRRFLGGSSHSVVFLSEYKTKNLPDVAIKFVPADTLQSEAQLLQWRAATALSHPHLLRLFNVGRCQLGGRGFLFVVMEYAEQTLAQVLPKRALSPDEVREMLRPTLDALVFLHRKHRVHGQLKPSNFLVVNDQLKLASDTVRPPGNAANAHVETSVYDPPELKDRVISGAGDIWGLGITLVEALTQRTPGWPDQTDFLPANLPAPFGDTVRRCLSPAPADRPTVFELANQYTPAAQDEVISVPQPPAPETPGDAPPPENVPRKYLLVAGIAGVLQLSLAAWLVLRPSAPDIAQSDLQAPAALTEPVEAAAPLAVANPAESGSPLPADTSRSVLHEETPDVPRKIQDRIQGRIPVTVRVLVDPSGDVVGQLIENPGPSKYFARLAGEAAREWKFAPADTQDSRVWLLRFEFTRDGVTARPAAQ